MAILFQPQRFTGVVTVDGMLYGLGRRQQRRRGR